LTKYTEDKLCISWFSLNEYIEMHGQQNVRNRKRLYFSRIFEAHPELCGTELNACNSVSSVKYNSVIEMEGVLFLPYISSITRIIWNWTPHTVTLSAVLSLVYGAASC